MPTNEPSAYFAWALSAREVEVIALLPRGFTNRQIALELSVSEHTVARHIHNILTKIGATSRAQAAAFAVRNRLDGGSARP
jgi:DNA-binding NarL/FixJ family response regulator